mmetsp:Transcript_27923/g.59332  ORF Transcript_27923/g.59332 Transcript_27923/m.59332 type:complete len:156 (+) Transcript_27923:74-541(+)
MKSDRNATLEVRLLLSCVEVVLMQASISLALVHIRMSIKLHSRRKPQRKGSWIMQSREVAGSLVQSVSVPHLLRFHNFAKSAQNQREGVSTNRVTKPRPPHLSSRPAAAKGTHQYWIEANPYNDFQHMSFSKKTKVRMKLAYAPVQSGGMPSFFS